MKRLILPAVILAASVVPLAVTNASNGRDGGVHEVNTAPTASQLARDLRRLWTDHVIWTREYIVAALDGHASAGAAATRLLRNQEDIGKAVGTFYGEPAGRQLTVLLKEHITVAVDLIDAAKRGDKSAYARADAAWQQNGIAIADFLSKANPHWPRQALVDMMAGHLSTTTTMVVARLNKDWEADARAFDEVYEHILHMSDALAAGIAKQFPDRVAHRD